MQVATSNLRDGRLTIVATYPPEEIEARNDLLAATSRDSNADMESGEFQTQAMGALTKALPSEVVEMMQGNAFQLVSESSAGADSILIFEQLPA